MNNKYLRRIVNDYLESKLVYEDELTIKTNLLKITIEDYFWYRIIAKQISNGDNYRITEVKYDNLKVYWTVSY
jgi:hypothetical protein